MRTGAHGVVAPASPARRTGAARVLIQPVSAGGAATARDASALVDICKVRNIMIRADGAIV